MSVTSSRSSKNHLSGQLNRCIVDSTGVGIFLGLRLAMHRRMHFLQRRLIRCQVHCTDECNLLIIGLTGDSRLSLSWSFRLGFLHGLFNSCPLDRRGGPSGLAMPIFSLSLLEPKSLRMVILTIILVQVLCVSSIAKTLYWSMAWEAIFATSVPSLIQTSSPYGPSLQSLDLPFTIATGPSSQALSWSSQSHDSISCLICNELHSPHY